MGLATNAEVSLLNQAGAAIELGNTHSASSSGPLLITHWGMSGPAILKLSAWGARALHQLNYRFKIRVNWLPQYNVEDMLLYLTDVKQNEAKKHVHNTRPFDLPKRLWLKL